MDKGTAMINKVGVRKGQKDRKDKGEVKDKNREDEPKRIPIQRRIRRKKQLQARGIELRSANLFAKRTDTGKQSAGR